MSTTCQERPFFANVLQLLSFKSKLLRLGPKRILKLPNKDKEFFIFVIRIVGQKLRIIPDAGQFFYFYIERMSE